MGTNRSPHNHSEEVSLLQALPIKADAQQSKMATPVKTLATQRTFDSSDDLLENEEDLDLEDDNPPSVVRKEVAIDPSVWDCRAVHWPPHSIKSLVESGLGYIKSPWLLAEVLFLGVFLYLCHILPRKFDQYSTLATDI